MFVEDDGLILRFQLETGDVRIGRDQSNDIWIDSPAVRPQTCLVYHRDGDHNLKIFEGAKVVLNGQIVRGLQRLYSGDRIGVGDRELTYARDDAPAQVAVGLTVLLDGEVKHGLAYRRTRVKIGRRDADLVLDDPSVADGQLVIESYSDQAFYAFDLGSEVATTVNGKPLRERCRLRDGDVIAFGRAALRVSLLPAEAHGLLLAAPLPERPLVPPAAPKPMDRSPAQRMDPSANYARQRQASQQPVQGGFIRPQHSLNSAAEAQTAGPVPLDKRPPAPEPAPDHAADAPLATQIGSLQQLLRDSQREQMLANLGAPQHTVLGDAVRLHLGPAPVLRPEELQPVPDAAPPAIEQPRRPPVRIQVEGPAREQAAPQQRRPVWQDESSQRENLRVRPREAVQEQQMQAVSGPRQGAGFHEQRTEMLDTAAVRENRDWQQDPVLRRVFADAVVRPEGAPATAVLDTAAPPPPLPKQHYDPASQWQPGMPVRDDDPRHRKAPPPTRSAEDLRQPGAQDRYRLNRTTGAHDSPAPDQRPPDLRPAERNGNWDGNWEGRREPAPPPREDWRRTGGHAGPENERYRLGRGEPPPSQVQDDRPRVRVRDLSEAERQANPDWAQATDRPRAPQGETDASRREREQRIIDASRRGFDRDK